MRKVGERLWDPVHVVNFNLFSMTWGIASYILGCASQHIGSLQVLDRWCLVVADHELRKHEKGYRTREEGNIEEDVCNDCK